PESEHAAPVCCSAWFGRASAPMAGGSRGPCAEPVQDAAHPFLTPLKRPAVDIGQRLCSSQADAGVVAAALVPVVLAEQADEVGVCLRMGTQFAQPPGGDRRVLPVSRPLEGTLQVGTAFGTGIVLERPEDV